MERRGFLKLCGSAAAAVGARPEALAEAGGVLRSYEPALLVRPDGTPLRAGRLETGQCYIFHYPYVTTPCFLIELGRPALPDGPLETEDGSKYQWPGGVGSGRSVVAFAAICAHRMTHPARAVSFMNYRHEEVRFEDARHRQARGKGVIYCCSERSVYDPARGARVLGGPAPQPLAAIALTHAPGEDTLHAAGTFGGEMYERFFAEFRFRLELEFETADPRRRVSGESVVVPIEEYSNTRVHCG